MDRRFPRRGWSPCGALLVVFLSGCAHVSPYERGKLAHRSMVADHQGPAAGHVLAVQEGATGGATLAESGCGCN